ncbi:MAG: multifunctional CCA addition/repair protein [Gammaproteobacteria bacterium]|nr:multifunctional CCA addition/repair protein [Gammaproteobacteria bacterium]
MEVYLVGGAVRDELLGRTPGERDWVVVGATPEELLAAGYRRVGNDFPVFLHPVTGEEYALARTERKTGRGYRGFETRHAPDVTLEDDLRRRDLTINAIARAADGTLIDPCGGQRDLAARVLRHVSPAFVEDPVRVLRVARLLARFAPAGFTVAPETLALLRTMVAAGEVDALVPERVWQETIRALGEPAPAAWLRLLRECGALARVLPEVDALYGVPQPARWHPEIDTGRHLELVLAAAAELTGEPRIVCAALLHDLGKGQTPRERWPAHHGHGVRGAALVQQLASRLRMPNDCRDLACLAARWHGHVHRALELRPGTLLGLLEGADALRRPGRFGELLRACEADFRGRGDGAARPYPQAAYLASALAAARAVTLSADEHCGCSGDQIAALLREQRLAALAALPKPAPAQSTAAIRPGRDAV